MGDFNVNLGRGKNADSIEPSSFKGGMNIDQFVGSDYENIFEALEAHYAKEGKYKGSTKGVLEQSEIEGLKQDINEAKGKNQTLSKHEAKGLLAKLGLKGKVDVETFFKFLSRVGWLSSNIENSTTDKNGNTTTLTKPDENGVQTEHTKDSSGETTKVVKYMNKGTENETYEVFDKNNIKIAGKDEKGEYAINYLENGYEIVRGNSHETYNKENKFVTGRDDKGEYKKIELENGEYKLLRKDGSFLIYNSSDEVIGGMDEYGDPFQRTYNENGYTDSYNFTTQEYNKDGKILKESSSGFNYEYEYDDKGNQVKTIQKDPYGNITGSTEFEYDENGKVTKETKYNNKNEVYESLEYEYDDKGNLKKEIYYGGDNSEVSYYTEYEYNQNGNLIQKNNYNGANEVTTSTEYEYDENGNLIKDTFYDGGKVESYTKYKYDKNGNLTEEIYKNGDGDIRSTTKYEYDEQGNKTAKIFENEDGINKEVYDKKGYITQDINNDKEGNITDYYQYRYDEKYNQSKEHKDNENNVLETFYRDDRKNWYIPEEDEEGNVTYKYDNNNRTVFAQKDSEGNWVTDVREGDTFADTMAKLGITEERLGENYERAKELFTNANLAAANRRGGGWFKVGQMEVKIPKELAEFIDLENHISYINIDSEEEIENWEKHRRGY